MQLQIGKPLRNLLAEPQNKKRMLFWADLIINFASASEKLCWVNDNNLASSLMLALLENVCIFGKVGVLNKMLKFIKMDTKTFFDWKYWDQDMKADCEKFVLLLLGKIKEETKKDDFINLLCFLYEFKEQEKNSFPSKKSFEELLNILTRYLVLTYVIEQKDKIFKKEKLDEEFQCFLKETNLMRLSEPLSNKICNYFSKMFSINIQMINYSDEEATTKKELFSYKESAIPSDIPSEEIIFLLKLQKEKTFRILYTWELEKLLFFKANRTNVENFCKTLSYNLVSFCEKTFQARFSELKNSLENDVSNSSDNYFRDYVRSKLSGLFNLTKDNSKIINDIVNVKKLFLTPISDNQSLLQVLTELWDRTDPKDLRDTLQQKKSDIAQLEKQILELKHMKINIEKNEGKTDAEKFDTIDTKKLMDFQTTKSKQFFLKKQSLDSCEHDSIEGLLENNMLFFNTSVEEKGLDKRKIIERKKSRLMVSEEVRRRKSCFICSKVFIRDEDIKTLACGDEVCRCCAENWITTRVDKGLTDLSRLPCFNYRKCQKFLLLEEIAHVLGEYKMEKLLQDFIEKPRFTVKPIFLCPICGSDISEEKEIKTFECNHKICRECVSNWLDVKFSDGSCEISNVKCLIQDCNQYIGVATIKDVMGEDKLISWTERALWGNCIVCPYKDCGTPFINEIEQNAEISCPLCARKLCLNCKDPAHEKGICPKLYSIIGQSLKPEDRINMCPKCFTPYFKDENCEHVRCGACKIDFCFRCSCLRQPTLIHGNHYHRKECPFFFAVKDMKHEENYNPDKCENCKKHKRACQKPLSYKKFCLKLVNKETYDKFLAKNVLK